MSKRVFLGGTCNESTWRDFLISILDIEYFNPVVEDWTADCMAEELRQRVSCEVCLYTITPQMMGVYSIAEVVDDSNKRPEATVLCLLEGWDGSIFDTGQWKSLKAVANMVSENGGKVSYDLRDVAEYLNMECNK